VVFGVSAEEAGLILQQLPEHSVELLRKADRSNMSAPAGKISSFSSISADVTPTGAPDKVLRITPAVGGTISFEVDFEKDGVSHSSTFGGEGGFPPGISGPLAVTVQLGEFQVLRELLRSSIPKLLGWDIMTDVAIERMIDEAINNTGSSYGTDDVPF
jgi:hypothetical protein